VAAVGLSAVLSHEWQNPMWWLVTAVILFKAGALVDALTHREDAYRAADKRTKPFWLVVLSLALGLDLLFTNSIFGIFVLMGLVAAIVYMVDVRPAIKGLTGGGRGRGRRGNAGPYGPW
jgi:RsiW-degrading membrane proteinase PrsW (M82 family)